MCMCIGRMVGRMMIGCVSHFLPVRRSVSRLMGKHTGTCATRIMRWCAFPWCVTGDTGGARVYCRTERAGG